MRALGLPGDDDYPLAEAMDDLAEEADRALSKLSADDREDDHAVEAMLSRAVKKAAFQNLEAPPGGGDDRAEGVSGSRMIGKLNHVGVATPSIEESWKLYRDVMGVSDITPRRALPEQGVWVSFVNLPNAQIELIEPYGETRRSTGSWPRIPAGVSTMSVSRWKTSLSRGMRCGPRARPCWEPASRGSAPMAFR